MKLMIASDIHGSSFYCKEMLDAFDREQADKLLLLGDILYHGPRNDLPKDYGLLALNGKTIYATHGHNFNRESLPPMQSSDILLHGHTHIPAWESFGGHNLYLNPGSVSIPKEGSAHGYMTLSENEVLWKDLSGGVYHKEVI